MQNDILQVKQGNPGRLRVRVKAALSEWEAKKVVFLAIDHCSDCHARHI